MTFTSSLAFFNHLMNEDELDDAGLMAFLARPTSDEGLHLDFKSGQELDKPRDKRNFTVRQYVAAFANSEGGVLVIGVKDQTIEEKRRRLPKVLAPISAAQETAIGGDLARWAKDCVAEMIGYLGVPPRFKVVDVGNDKVLLIAVPRAPSLVPVIKDGKQAYYFRVEDEAREVYPHLVSDLVLGRRQTPNLVPTTAGWRVQATRHASFTIVDGVEHSQGGEVLRFGGAMDFTNNSLVTAHDLSTGVLGFSVKTRAEEPEQVIPDDLRQRITVLPHPVSTQHPYALFHHRFMFPGAASSEGGFTRTGRPFDTLRANLSFQWTVEGRTPRQDELVLALYIVPEGCEPLWFEAFLPLYLEAPTKRDGAILDARIVRVHGRRPRVALAIAREESA